MRARLPAPFSALFSSRPLPLALAPSVAVLAFAVLATPGEALADCNPPNQVSSCVDSDNFWPHAGATRFLGIGSAETIAPDQLSFGLITSFQKKPIVLRYPGVGGTTSEVAAIDNQANATFLTAYSPTEGIQVHFAAPMSLYQSGVGTGASSTQTPAPIVRSVVRDVRFGATIVLLPFSATGQGFGLAYRTDFAFATGDESVFGGGRTPTTVPSLTAEYRRGDWTLAAEGGARLRPVTAIAGTRVGSQIAASIGAGYSILPKEMLSVQVEANALVTLAEQRDLVRDANNRLLSSTDSGRRLIPAEWLASLRTAPLFGTDLAFHGGFGTSLPLSEDRATSPSFRVVGGLRYAPLGRDADHDGILDRDDKCPNVPEDLDSFEDTDGCPELDNDRDGIPDAQDRCRDTAEDKDGFQDEDGCPDLDDDNDGVPDAEDKCRSEAEDKDNFEDEDGCPDLDNDGDGIPDSKDACPYGPEDKDGFRDEDGCPDPDNDADGIPDADDKCPLLPEDKDGFEDDDGCPDPDNDKDGVADGADKCPTEAETINGIDDEDGCPEPGAKDLISLKGTLVVLDTPARFPRGSAKVTPEVDRAARMIAQKIKSFGFIERAIVEVYADTSGATARNERLANERADAIRGILTSTGLPLDLVTIAAGDLGEKRAANASHLAVQIIPKRAKK
jgi:OmpA-OmpF porin, OOP family